MGGFLFFVFLNPRASILKFWMVSWFGNHFLFKSILARCESFLFFLFSSYFSSFSEIGMPSLIRTTYSKYWQSSFAFRNIIWSVISFQIQMHIMILEYFVEMKGISNFPTLKSLTKLQHHFNFKVHLNIGHLWLDLKKSDLKRGAENQFGF